MADDEFDFSDDEFDHLPANTLDHLEASAFRATQQQQQQHQANKTHDAESDYGLDDDGDEVVNLDDAPQSQHAYQHDEYEHVGHGMQPDPKQLLERIKKLEQDKARERREAQELKLKLQTKAGEADTLRRRYDADTRRHERQLADQQHAHSTQVAKLRADMDKLRREKDEVQTDNMFNQHEAREAAIVRRTARAMPSRPKSVAPAISPVGTPRKVQKTLGPLGDGFDDDDVVMASPSKHRQRQKTATPKQQGKRKRHVTDQSPIPLPALQLSEPRSRPSEQEPPQIHVALLHHFRRDDRRFTLLHRLLSHPSSNGTDRILEALTLHAFPSKPSKRLSSIVYDALSDISTPDVHELALHMCHIFLDLWKQCQNEKHYTPTALILDALHFILACEPVKTAVKITDRVVPLIIATVDLVADPISKAAKGEEKAVADLYSPRQREIASQIHVQDCLELLHFIASSCLSSSDPGAVTRLWQMIPSSFAIMLLVKEQPQQQITLMLRILATSALTNTLGPITTADSAQDNQANNEDALLNRLTNLLTEIPKPVPDSSPSPPSPQAISEPDLWDLRLLVLSVLTQFSIPEYGSSRLAQNRLCIGRLIKYLDYCITSLYRCPMSPTQDHKVDSINATMKLIYHVATTNADFDIKSKLVNTLGGQHAYLVALTRLAFSEGLVLEAGIEDEVVNMAHDILDQGLSMEEGDAFGKVFSSGSTT
ncbi:hypothetical protein CFE70_004001 [Pyrenophora teres f. teres 0-1]|uniref:Uncharacterized protein n=2 Tax=Pyrenophora teres f. teres TaxID=97479 RepID=E3RGY1_PYRTT|nr:hypothetical protein PTT_07112 [Pyrenophora teres f. teres 0-1]KAE8847667.1 hypothetical protein PTNB85_01510 [Pyrenophora teres f. teres]KAE8854176.1 hypothetical protein HRS9122_01168 [Pyrenophora teres f. teres]KAE8867595.1 hypothetical protein PTNB29_01506 [Pyrenophora teres f. teres]CAE7027938.1 hypothetical protein PTTW11_04332 [Pyrenophora teres f. teres]